MLSLRSIVLVYVCDKCWILVCRGVVGCVWSGFVVVGVVADGSCMVCVCMRCWVLAVSSLLSAVGCALGGMDRLLRM